MQRVITGKLPVYCRGSKDDRAQADSSNRPPVVKRIVQDDDTDSDVSLDEPIKTKVAEPRKVLLEK